MYFFRGSSNMRTLRFITMALLTSFFCLHTQAEEAASAKTTNVPLQELYPDGALMQIYQEELYEIKKTEDAERRAVKARDDYERRKVEAEKEISAKKYKIEGFKIKQEQVATEIDAMNTEIQYLDKQYQETEQELAQIEAKAQEHFVIADNAKKELDDTKNKLEQSLDNLKNSKEKIHARLNKNSIDVQKMRSEIAVLEAEVESVEAQKADLEAKEMSAKTEWMSLRAQIDQKNADKKRNLESLAAAKKRYEQVQKDYRQAKNEFEQADQSRRETQAKVNAEIKKLEESTGAAIRARAMADAEKIRVEAETEKLKAYVAMVKKSNDESLKAMKESQVNVMESRLALETAKSELTMEVAGGEKQKFTEEKISSRLRNLASVAEASDMMDGAQSWTIVKSCTIMKRPSRKADIIGEVSSGQNLVASRHSTNWVKIMNSSGEPAFVRAECGNF